MQKTYTCKICGNERPYMETNWYLSEPIPANQYWPNSFVLMWVSTCCRRNIAHTEAAAAFGERDSNREKNKKNASAAVAEFNALEKRTVDAARRIVHKHHGKFVFDRWLDQCG